MNEKWSPNAVLSEIFSGGNVLENFLLSSKRSEMMISFCVSCQASDNITKLDSEVLIDLIVDLHHVFISQTVIYTTARLCHIDTLIMKISERFSV